MSIGFWPDANTAYVQVMDVGYLVNRAMQDAYLARVRVLDEQRRRRDELIRRLTARIDGPGITCIGGYWAWWVQQFMPRWADTYARPQAKPARPIKIARGQARSDPLDRRRKKRRAFVQSLEGSA
jgi:hypothetical protein